MEQVSWKTAVAVALSGLAIGGCATSVEMGPGYYHYDSHLAHPGASVPTPPDPPVTYQSPPVTYNPPAAAPAPAGAVVQSSPVGAAPATTYDATRTYRNPPLLDGGSALSGPRSSVTP